MRTLVLFARRPRPGQVKSRLSPALPPEPACRLYEAMLRDVLEAGRAAEVDERWLAWADESDAPDFFAAGNWRAAVQQGADLGERLEWAMREMLRGPESRLVVIGADAPEIAPSYLGAAFEALASHDVALGPTRDGGYYLLGLRRPAPEIVRGIPWGRGGVLAATLERCRAAGLAAALLEPLEDVDTPEDLVRLLIRCREDGRRAPHTAAALAALGLLPGAEASTSAEAGPA